LIFTRFCKSTLLSRQSKLEMLKLHTRTQQTLFLILNGLVCYMCTSGVCDKALKKCWRVEKCDRFLLTGHFCHSKFLTKWRTASEIMKLWLLTLSIRNSIQVRNLEHQSKTSQWLEEPAGKGVPLLFWVVYNHYVFEWYTQLWRFSHWILDQKFLIKFFSQNNFFSRSL
jgi:hypothetical protein